MKILFFLLFTIAFLFCKSQELHVTNPGNPNKGGVGQNNFRGGQNKPQPPQKPAPSQPPPAQPPPELPPNQIPQTEIVGDPLIVEIDLPTPAEYQAPIVDYVKNFIEKYSELIVEGTEDAANLYPSVTAFAATSSKILGPLGTATTIADVLQGKWGSAVCLAVGISPFPSGIIGQSVCDIFLVTIRYKNDKDEKDKDKKK
jgi:hypothetical protein